MELGGYCEEYVGDEYELPTAIGRRGCRRGNSACTRNNHPFDFGIIGGRVSEGTALSTDVVFTGRGGLYCDHLARIERRLCTLA